MSLSTRYQVLFLAVLSLGVYYPVIFAGFSPTDDLTMINNLMETGSFDLWGLFFPGGGTYYRPLTMGTFVLDRLLWDSQPSFMHVENILLHLLNACLVFAVARNLCRGTHYEHGGLSLLAAVLFAFHPVNTESVSWISGRTDLLAATFVLGALWFLLRALDGPSPWRMLAALLLFFAGCLAKEVAFFFVGGAALLIVVRAHRSETSLLRAVRNALPSLFLWMATAGAYLLLRRIGLSGRDSGVGTVLSTAQAVSGDAASLLDQVRVVFKVLGFYLTKLFVPWPLNFAIIGFSDLYVIGGLLLAGVAIWLLLRADRTAALFLAGLCTLSAALFVIFGKSAWTLVAERYLYVPSAFFVLGWLSWYLGRERSSSDLLVIPLGICLAAGWGGVTLHRSFVWGDPVTLLEDTLEKSPGFVPVRKDLAYLYAAQGETEKASKLYAVAVEQVGDRDYAAVDLDRAQFLAMEGKLDEAHGILKGRLENPGRKYDDLVKVLLFVNGQRLEKATTDVQRLAIHRENADMLQENLRRAETPFGHYLLAKEYMELGENQSARRHFEIARDQAPFDAHYREPARKLAVAMAAKGQ